MGKDIGDYLKIGDNIKMVREKSGKTQREIAVLLGIPVSTYSNYENGNRSPNMEVLNKLAELLNVELSVLLGVEPHESLQLNSKFKNVAIDDLRNEITIGFHRYRKIAPATAQGPSTIEILIDKYRMLDEHGKKAVDAILDIEHMRCVCSQKLPVDPPEADITILRFSEYKASAGRGAYLGPEAFKDLKVKATDLTERADFCVQVTGNSMEPSYHNGDLLLVECMPDISVGEIGIFTLGGEAYVKKRGDQELIPLNPKYPTISFDETVRCNGLVIGLLDPKLIVEK